MIRRYGEPVRKGTRYTFRPGVYAILWNGDGLLMTFQEEPVPEFQLPGGGVDPGENLLPALHREVMEETGWTIAAPRRLGAFRRFAYMPEYDVMAEKLCHVYLARPVLRRGPPTESAHSEVWMSPEAAIRNIANPGDRSFLKAVFE